MSETAKGLLLASTSSGSGGGVTPPPDPPFIGDLLAAVGTSPYLRAWKYDATLGLVTTYSTPSQTTVCDSAKFTPDGNAVIVGERDATTGYIGSWAYTPGSGFGVRYSNPATPLSGTTTKAVAINKESSVVFATSTSSIFLNAYAWDSTTGFGAKYSDPATIPQASLTDLAVSPTGLAVCVTRSNSGAPYQFQAYSFDPAVGFGSLYSYPSVSGASYAVTWSWDGETIFGTTGSAAYAWPWSDATGFGAAYASLAAGASTQEKSLAVTSDSSAVVLGKFGSFAAYSFTVGVGFGSALTGLTGSGNGRRVQIAPTNDLIAISMTGSGYGLRVYDWSASGFGSLRNQLIFSVTGYDLDWFYTGV